MKTRFIVGIWFVLSVVTLFYNYYYGGNACRLEIENSSLDSNIHETVPSHHSLQRSITPLDISRALYAKANPDKVFIMTMPRSGSSFLGELFRQNPNFLYLYEVTKVFETQDYCSDTFSDKQRAIFYGIFNCDFWELREGMSKAFKWDFWNYTMRLSSTQKSTMCFPTPYDSKELIEQRSRQSIAIKEISWWAPKLNDLYSLVGAQLKVVWLVRDVRGWVSSYLEADTERGGKLFYETWGYTTTNFWNTYKSCRGLNDVFNAQRLENLQSLMQNKTAPVHKRLAAVWTVDQTLAKHYVSQFPGKIFLVQYEHLSSYPFDVAQQIYQFIGQPIDGLVVQFLGNSTAKGDITNRYSTSRDSEKMASIWLERLTFAELQEIEDIVGAELMDFFKYKRVAELKPDSPPTNSDNSPDVSE